MLSKVEFYPDILARRTVETDLTNSNVCFGVLSSQSIGWTVGGGSLKKVTLYLLKYLYQNLLYSLRFPKR